MVQSLFPIGSYVIAERRQHRPGASPQRREIQPADRAHRPRRDRARNFPNTTRDHYRSERGGLECRSVAAQSRLERREFKPGDFADDRQSAQRGRHASGCARLVLGACRKSSDSVVCSIRCSAWRNIRSRRSGAGRRRLTFSNPPPNATIATAARNAPKTALSYGPWLPISLTDLDNSVIDVKSGKQLHVMTWDVSGSGVSFVCPNAISQKQILIGLHLNAETTNWFIGEVVRTRIVAHTGFYEHVVAFRQTVVV